MSTMTNILLCYTGRDANYRSLLVAATRAADLPVRFVEVSGAVTDPASRRALCAARLQQCEAAIVLVSPQAWLDQSVNSDVATTAAHGLPVYGIEVSRKGGGSRGRDGLKLQSKLDWSWPRIAAFLQRFEPANATTVSLAG